MIGTSPWEYVFIRFWVSFLNWIAPLSVLYCVATFVLRISQYRILGILEALCVAETAFYLFVYLPRRYLLQASATHPEPLNPEERYELFKKCHERITDPERYLRKWFLDAPLSEIKRENVKDFFRWAFLNKGELDPEDDEELERYTTEAEEMLERRLEPGRGSARCMALTVSPVDMLHRSLIWYWCVSVVDTLTYTRMLYHSFHFHRTSVVQTMSIFPPRPLSLTSRFRSPAKRIPYWHRPHLAKNKLPILFIHGIGIGLYPYVNFIRELNEQHGEDEQIGIIAVELMPISCRLTHEAMGKEEICEEIRQIVTAHGWDQFVMVAHSYGTGIATQLLSTPSLAEMIKATLLIDPITFLLHLPDVAYNFTQRKPRRANEYQLNYFASKDMGIAHTLGRRFFWSENILWKDDIEGKQVAVSLGGKDLIVNTASVWNYLTHDERRENANGHVKENGNGHVTENGNGDVKENGNSHGKENGNGHVAQPNASSRIVVKAAASKDDTRWKDENLDVLWFANLDHAQVFDKKRTRRMLVEVVRGFCSQGSLESREPSARRLSRVAE